MKKIKTLLSFAAVLALAFTVIFALAACVETHECGHVCPVKDCGKCLDKDCTDAVCAEKCPGHEPAPHVCGHVCPVEGCGKCLDKDCDNPVCANKCPGHEPAAHVCGHVCEICGKCLDADCTDDVCADKCQGHKPEAHVCEHVCPVKDCGKCLDKECTDPVCADKCEHIFYTITLNVGEGTLPESAKTTYQAANTDGLIILPEGEFLPEPTIGTAHYRFDNWYDAETGGNAIDETKTVFDKDTTIYARYVREDGVWVGDAFKGALVKNTGASGTGGLNAEYWLGGGSVELAKGDEISIYLGGKLLSVYVEASSAGIESVISGSKYSKVIVKVAGAFKFYVKDYSSSSKPDNWVCEYAGPTEVIVGSDIPEGCAPVHITWGGGANEITFFIVSPAAGYENGKPVGAEELGKYCFYTFGGVGGELFGNWAASRTNGKCAVEMTSTKTGMPEGWILRWNNGNNQTANIYGLENGGTYILKFGRTGAEAEVTKITIASKHTVTLDLGYAEQPATKTTVKAYNGKLTYNPLATREGYDFAGWYDAETGGNAVTLETVFSADATIYARWTVAKKVTFDENYAEQSAEKTTAYAYGGKLAALPAPVREGYDFLGWFSASEDGEAITLDTEFTADTTIYAHWRLCIVITLDLNYEGQPAEKTTITIKNGKFISANFPEIPTRTDNFECIGWYTLAEDGTKVTTSTVFTENATIYAQWRVPFVITFDENYDGQPDPKATATAVQGKLATLPTPEARDGYEFLGWFTVAEETGGNQIYTSTTFAADTTIYARWRVPFVITFNFNYEDCPENTQLTASLGKLAVLPEDPVRDGYEFLGWYTVAETTGGRKVSTFTTFTSDTTVYARWRVPFVITFDLNYEGCVEPTTETAVLGKLTALPTPVRDGYTFNGWYTMAEGGTKVSVSKSYTADTTIYAHWTAVVEEEE